MFPGFVFVFAFFFVGSETAANSPGKSRPPWYPELTMTTPKATTFCADKTLKP